MPYIKVRGRNQLTLPKELSKALQVQEGDFLEVSTVGNAVILTPTRIVPFGSPEGEAEHRRAVQDFQQGRYKSFNSIEEFSQYLQVFPTASGRTAPTGVDVKHSFPELAPLITSVTRLVAEAMHENHGDPAAAAKALERTHQAVRGHEE